MNFSESWGNTQSATNVNPWDAKNQDEVLMEWERRKRALENAKADEMDFRKYVVSRAFPQKHEGTNTIELGNDYKLKAVVKYNYNLDASNDKIEDALDRIAKIGNRGIVVAERLIKWTPSFLLTEYRLLEEEKNESNDAKEILKIIQEFLVITEAAPTLDIVEPKKAKE